MQVEPGSEPLEPQSPAPQAAPGPQVIVAGPGKSYRTRRFLMAAILFAAGMWCVYDGFYAWPRENAGARKNNIEDRFLPHPGWDVPLNQGLGAVLPLVAIGVFAHCLYTSRGAYRLVDGVLSVPGHPPVSLSQVRDLDLELWDRKGIARVEYLPARGREPVHAKLDDFLYDQDATTDIVVAIDAYLAHVAEHGVSPGQRAKALDPALKPQRLKLAKPTKTKNEEYPRM